MKCLFYIDLNNEKQKIHILNIFYLIKTMPILKDLVRFLTKFKQFSNNYYDYGCCLSLNCLNFNFY